MVTQDVRIGQVLPKSGGKRGAGARRRNMLRLVTSATLEVKG